MVGRIRTHTGWSTHPPDVPHERTELSDDPLDQDVYCRETSLGTAKFPCLSEIWKRKLHHRISHWSKDVSTAFGTRGAQQKSHKGESAAIFWLFASQVDSCSTISLILTRRSGKEWCGSINSISSSWFQTELLSRRGLIRWTAHAVGSEWSDGTVWTVLSARSDGKTWSVWMEWSDGMTRAVCWARYDGKTSVGSSWLTRSPPWAVSMTRAGRCSILGVSHCAYRRRNLGF